MTRRQPRLPGVRHRTVRVDGLRMHVAEAGEEGRPAVVLLHGWPQHWYAWRHVIPLLAADHHVICPDQRGFGWTEAPASGYDKEQLAADILGLLDALRLDRVQLVGHDWGGIVGFLVCAHAPDRVEDYLALNTGHLWPARELRSLLQGWRVAPYQSLLSAPVLGPVFARRAMVPLVDRLMQRQGAWTPAAGTSFRAQFDEPERLHATEQMYRTFLMRELPSWGRGAYHGVTLEVPTVMLHGAADPVLHPDLVRGFAVSQPNVRFELLEGIGHFTPEEAPQAVVDRILMAKR